MCTGLVVGSNGGVVDDDVDMESNAPQTDDDDEDEDDDDESPIKKPLSSLADAGCSEVFSVDAKGHLILLDDALLLFLFFEGALLANS
jgi:hypothetical protein